jgi:hypothetical protein
MIGSPLQQLLVLLVCSASGGLACPSFQLGWRTSGSSVVTRAKRLTANSISQFVLYNLNNRSNVAEVTLQYM